MVKQVHVTRIGNGWRAYGSDDNTLFAAVNHHGLQLADTIQAATETYRQPSDAETAPDHIQIAIPTFRLAAFLKLLHVGKGAVEINRNDAPISNPRGAHCQLQTNQQGDYLELQAAQRWAVSREQRQLPLVRRQAVIGGYWEQWQALHDDLQESLNSSWDSLAPETFKTYTLQLLLAPAPSDAEDLAAILHGPRQTT